MRLVYSLLCYLLAPLVFGYFAYRGIREAGYAHGWLQRLGFGSMPQPGCIWIHAASVGEVQVATPLLRALAARYPDYPLLVTVFTPTGLERARVQLGDIAAVRYLPLDLPGATRRFVAWLRPCVGVIVETELWPNLLHGCGRYGVPVVLANASISQRSAGRYAKAPLRGLMRAALSNIVRVCASSAADADRIVQLQVPPEKVVVTGNLKFDLVVDDQLVALGQTLRDGWGARPVWVAASTHQGEEALVLDALGRVREQIPDVLLVLVPRHPQRFDTVADLCDERGFNSVRRSAGAAVRRDTNILLVDTLGELPAFYAAADVALVGGSLVPGIGGHNLLEPAALGVPVITGEYLDGVRKIADLLTAGDALVRVVGAPALATAVGDLLGSAAARARSGQAAKQVVQAHSGALQATVSEIAGLLPRPQGGLNG